MDGDEFEDSMAEEEPLKGYLKEHWTEEDSA